MRRMYRTMCIFGAVFPAIIIVSAAFAQTGLKEDYEKLKKQYELVTADRDNILAQTKTLLEYKTRYRDLETEYAKVKEELDKTRLELQILQQQAADLKQNAADGDIFRGQLERENKDLKNSLEKMTVEYKIVPETRKEMAELKNENSSLKRGMQGLEAKLKQLTQKKLDEDAQAHIYRMQIKELKKRYEEALDKNRQLEKKAQQLPKRFAEMARENKTLIKETALMHYNLGVFYTKHKEYSRAVAEFEKSAELNSDDPSAFYNLGYIYAEYLVDRPKAIDYFKKYLSLAKTDDKDTDWVKKYILTWQTWEGKKPMK